MKTFNTPLIVLVAILISFGCQEIYEKNISNDEVYLVAPGDHLTLDSGKVTFYWEHLENSPQYSFQIVTGDFESPELLILDTVISSNKLKLQLDSGVYQWGVSAFNSNYQTPYSNRTITVNSKQVNNGTITLLFPANGQVLSDTTFQFNWRSNSSVDEYVFKIIDQPNQSSVTENEFVVKTFKNESRTYTWQVLAIIQSTNSIIESPIFSFSIEETSE